MTVRIYKVPSTNFARMNQVLSQDAFARNGYTFRSGKALSIDVEDYFLYVDADDEFLNANEPAILEVEGVTKVEGNEFDNVKSAVEAEDAAVASGISLFD